MLKSASSTHYEIVLGGKPVDVALSREAENHLHQDRQQAHVDVELELYFSCLIRKQVNFRASAREDAVLQSTVSDRLGISFRPVMTKVCQVSDVEGAPDVEAMPLQNPERFVPKWVKVDFRDGQWRGEFGY